MKAVSPGHYETSSDNVLYTENINIRAGIGTVGKEKNGLAHCVEAFGDRERRV